MAVVLQDVKGFNNVTTFGFNDQFMFMSFMFL